MRRFLLFALFFSFSLKLFAQSNQTVASGGATSAVTFAGTGCFYSWVNSNPSIGLPASGTDNIPTFTAINTGGAPVTATITATPTETNYAYIPNYYDNSVSVINTMTNIVVTTIPVGTNPLAVTVNSDGSRVYVSNSYDNTVSVINAITNQVIATITGIPSGKLILSPDGSKLYAANNAGTIPVINTATNTIDAIITTSSYLNSLAISSDGAKLYATNVSTNTVFVINTTSYSISNSIATGSQPSYIVLSPDNTKAYVASSSNSIFVINTSGNTVANTISLSFTPGYLCISPDGSNLYVTDANSGAIHVINTATNSASATITVTGSASGISITPDGKYVYVENGYIGLNNNTNANTVSIISTATNTVNATIPVGSHPAAIGNFISGGIGCNSSPVIFSITVNPAAILPAITASAATGNIFACVGTASASPDIQQFTASGSNLTNNVLVTAPTGFEVSLTSGSGYAASLALNQTSGSLAGTTIYVRSASGDAAGSLSGNVVLSSAGATNQSITVSGTVNALPTINAVPNQTVVNGAATTAVNFTGIGNNFTWTNDTPGIGLAASGTGNISSFTAVNTGSSPVIATITATPINLGYAYISNVGNRTVSLINTQTNTIVGSIAVGSQPMGISLSRDGSRMYVVNEYSGTVSAINTTTNAVIATITVDTSPLGVVVSPDGSKIYVTSSTFNNVAVINTATNTVITKIPVGGLPGAITISPDGSRVYVANGFNSDISVINTSTNTVVTNFSVGAGPSGVAASPDGKFIYVANGGQNTPGSTVSVVSTANYQIVSIISVGSQPSGIAVTPDGSRVFVVNSGSNSVSVINTATNLVVATIPVGNRAVGVSFTGDGSTAYVTNEFSDNVSAINTATNTVIATIATEAPTSFGNFVSGTTNCPGTPITFTITVNPTSLNPITASAVTGSITACAGTASASPNIQQFTIQPSITGVTATAPTGFEVSLSPGTGYSSSVTAYISSAASTGPPTANIYVRSAASDAAGQISGNVVLSSAGATNTNVAVSATINALPTVNAVANQTLYNGSVTAGTIFTGTGNYFTWTNDTPSIGLASSGTGNIGSFTAVNTGSTPITATITVTPQTTGLAYIANNGSNTISVLNIAEQKVINTIQLSAAPDGIAVSPDGQHAYITNNSSNSVTILTTATNALTTINTVASPIGIYVSHDNSTYYVASNSSNVVDVYSASNNTLISQITVGRYPLGIISSPDGSKIYIANSGDNTVSVINTATNTVTGTFTTDPSLTARPSWIVVSPDGTELYVSNYGLNNVSVINTSTGSITATIPTGTSPETLTISPDGSRVYVVNNASHNVSVINTVTNAVIITIPVYIFPTGSSITSDGSELCVTNSDSGTVSIINTANNTVSIPVPVGATPNCYGNFITPSGCPGTPVTYTITVLPSALTQIVAGTVGGYITSCQGTASADPDIEQFTVSGSNLTANVTATAPANFELSLNSGAAYASNVSIPETGGNLGSTTLYVRSAANAPSGNIYGNIALSSASSPITNVAVTGSIGIIPNALPSPSTQEILNGQSTDPVTFTGPGNAFTWTNDTPSIGLAASGSGGNIPTFTAINTGSAPVTATITVTSQQVAYAYIGNVPDNTTSIINTATNQVVKTIPGNYAPTGYAVNPNGKEVYETNDSNDNSATMSEINTDINEQDAGFGLPWVPGGAPLGIAITPDGNTVYIALENAKEIYSFSVANIGTSPPVTTYQVGGNPISVTVTPDDTKVFVTNSSEPMCYISTATGLITPINVSSNTYASCIHPNGNYLYVTLPGNNAIAVYNVITNAVVATIPVGTTPEGINISADGSRVYVTNNGSGNVSVINTVTNQVVATVTVGSAPYGVCATSDGRFVYVTNQKSNNVSVINTATNTVVATIAVGTSPASLGNFILPTSACSAVTSTFTITVDPTPAPTLTASSITGNITACQDSASVYPNVEQFTGSGAKLTGNVTVTAPANFEVSLNYASGYSQSMSLSSVGGQLINAIIYIRSVFWAPAGNIAGNVVLSSPGAVSQNVAVTGLINPRVTVANVADQTVENGNNTSAINFTGTGTNYDWVNDKPAIGLPASGTGNIAPFTAINTTQTPVVANITVMPEPDADEAQCGGIPTTFTITVKPTIINVIIPNTFTPNGDGINDTWEIKHLDTYPNANVDIFDRWGQKVFTSVGYPNPWDGKYKGVVLPSGTYYYVIDLKNGQHTLSGWLAIIR